MRSEAIRSSRSLHILLISQAHKSCYSSDFEVKVEGNIYAQDSTTIDLCLSVFWWAEFRRNKGGIKLHTLSDVKHTLTTRANDNIRLKRMFSSPVNKITGVLVDQTGKLEGYYSRKYYPGNLR